MEKNINKTKLEKRKEALKEWEKYVDTLSVEEAKEKIKDIKEYYDKQKK
jgi:uncharacterized membrane protein